MTDEEIKKLAAAIAIAVNAKAPEPEPEPEPVQEPKLDMDDLKTFVEGLVNDLGTGLKSAIQDENISRSRQPEPVSTEQILAKIINPPNKSE